MSNFSFVEDDDVVAAAAWVSSVDGHSFDTDAIKARLATLAEGAPGPDIGALVRHLRDTAGFVGQTSEYYRPENSYLDVVLEQRQGIPISLAVVYLAVAREHGLAAHGINFPGHFLVVMTGADEHAQLVDPFLAELISLEDCQQRIKSTLGADVDLTQSHLVRADAGAIAVRMLGNLKSLRWQMQDFDRALALSNAILALAPEQLTELRDRAFIWEKLDCLDAAIADFRELRDHYSDLETRQVLDQKISGLIEQSRAEGR